MNCIILNEVKGGEKNKKKEGEKKDTDAIGNQIENDVKHEQKVVFVLLLCEPAEVVVENFEDRRQAVLVAKGLNLIKMLEEEERE